MIKEKGFSYVENWCRVIKDTGSFRFKKAENLEIMYEWFPGSPKLDEGYKVHMSKCGDSYMETQIYSDGTIVKTPYKFDVETPYMGNYSVTYVFQQSN